MSMLHFRMCKISNFVQISSNTGVKINFEQLIEIIPLNGFVFRRAHFCANFEFKAKGSHRSISICPKQLLLGFAR